MNLIISKLQMISLEIAELVGSRHDKVKQSNSQNRFTEVYVFQGEQGKRDSIIVVAQLCPEFTARLVDRWQQLEQEKLGRDSDLLIRYTPHF